VDDASRNKMLALPSRNGINLPNPVAYPRSREEFHHSRHMHQCYPGEQGTREGQKTPPGNSGRQRLPRGHNAVPSRERLHLFHRAVSNHDTADHCSVGSFGGNCSPREPSLKFPHGAIPTPRGRASLRFGDLAGGHQNPFQTRPIRTRGQMCSGWRSMKKRAFRRHFT
jgi:hypothetical protein